MKCGAVATCDVSRLLSVWESRARKHRQREKKEQQRKERSALPKIEQRWQYRLYCRTLDTHQRHLLNDDPPTPARDTRTDVLADSDAGHESALSFRLSGEQWKDLPKDLEWKTFLLEWHVSGTKIQKLPDYLASFSLLRVLELSKNKLALLPPDIGKLGHLRRLNISYNRLSCVPAQLGMCRSLERLELAGNRNLSELPFELSSLKHLAHLDIAENEFASIPVCALRMSSLQFLDLSNNRLIDLPEDMDRSQARVWVACACLFQFVCVCVRLKELVTLFVHKNRLTYLPHCLTNISTLKMIVVSADQLVCVPTKLCSNPGINPASGKTTEDGGEEPKDGREKEFMDAYVNTLKDREDTPYSTTKVTISCVL
ncbi:leucine-rich repeat-containing protein 2-like isoform X2 [Syngnathus typhle]|uniref:leucine-rich repeat-containing protein 2-like isoform X2 n=1 Tax=Syngnathus typhle TaxID=161592 RepID=UPI002A69B091|nr:leucine-rich repeat-containing protein 2-like isoform X2 [Syngnathus typhle]